MKARRFGRLAAVLTWAAVSGLPALAHWDFTQPYKWLQYPDETTNGVDVDMTLGQPPLQLADDFACTKTERITDLHLWCSWRGDERPPDQILMFDISFWSDQPAPPGGFSQPLQMLWQTNVTYPSFTSRLWQVVMPGEGWYTPPESYLWPADTQIWQYNFRFDPSNAFLQQGTPARTQIYWVAVAVRVLAAPGQYAIGWKTSTNHWNDDAVWRYYPTGLWNELRYPPNHPYHPESMDLAFVLTTEAWDFGDALDPTYPTLLASNGARHLLTATGPWLGTATDNPDDEPDGQPNAGATGDDLDLGPGNPGPNRDDENGVVIPALIQGQNALVQITVSDPGGLGGWVDGWIDWNGDGTWGAGEQVIGIALPVGVTTWPVPVPLGGVVGPTYARFRINSLGPLGPTGPASDGEVEDYLVTVEEPQPVLDFGDAPVVYPTLLANNGARHVIVRTGPWLGDAADIPDDEPDGQPNGTATGDDTDLTPGNPGPNWDDENGVIFPPLIQGQNIPIRVIVSAPGTSNAWVDGWIDVNGDGDWVDPGEQVVSLLLPAGTNGVMISVPWSAVPGSRYARFRVNSTGPLAFAGLASDGEVEDYAVQIEDAIDFGDASDRPYPTLLANNGARHLIVPGVMLGTNIDAELDGQPDGTATGDDIAPAWNPDDEDGLGWPAILIRGRTYQIPVTASVSGFLHGWVDLNADGDWADPGEYVWTGTALPAGTTPVPLFIPPNATPGGPHARFRFVTNQLAVLSYTGLVNHGEVEDYELQIRAVDFGDAPDPTYPTLFASAGAWHVIDTRLTLGARIDDERDGQPNAAATGDDLGPPLADEDGITLVGPVIRGSNVTAGVVVTNATGNPAYLHVWVDWNADGDWADSGEYIVPGAAVTAGLNAASFSVPITAALGPTFARLRLTTALGPGTPGGMMPDGEVEDHRLVILQKPTQPVRMTNIVVVAPRLIRYHWNAESNITYLTEVLTNDLPGNVWTGFGPWVNGPSNNLTDSNAVEGNKHYRMSVPFAAP